MEPEERRDLELARKASVSLRRWSGWEPKRTTTVTEWDAEGRPTQWVTEIEPEFDANERDNWYALAEWEDALCVQCGQLRSICEDPEQAWYPQNNVCWSTAARMVATRRFQNKHEKAKPDGAGYLPTDGSVIWVSSQDLTPDDMFLS